MDDQPGVNESLSVMDFYDGIEPLHQVLRAGMVLHCFRTGYDVTLVRKSLNKQAWECRRAGDTVLVSTYELTRCPRAD